MSDSENPLFNAPGPPSNAPDADGVQKPVIFFAIGAGMVVLAAVLAFGVLQLGGDDDDFTSDDAPTRNDHWHVGFGLYDCDGFQPDIQNNLDPDGIHTHNDGVIHVHPFNKSATGANATLAKFAEALQLTDSFDEFATRSTCTIDGETVPAEFRVARFLSSSDTAPSDEYIDWRSVLLKNDEVLVMVLAPSDAEIPLPESIAVLDRYSPDAPAGTINPDDVCVFPEGGDPEEDKICGFDFDQ